MCDPTLLLLHKKKGGGNNYVVVGSRYYQILLLLLLAPLLVDQEQMKLSFLLSLSCSFSLAHEVVKSTCMHITSAHKWVSLGYCGMIMD